ncbi:hypothetical protein [Salinibaculum salinum]|uniref:hypothetical protein n=1 Tax=Salinibaculum salinum TaxID=3131996 RepID=UPI0030ECBFC8
MQRRGVLRLLGLAVAGLAGCASGDTERGDPPTRPPPVEPTPEPPTPTPTPSPTPTPERFADDLQTALGEVRVAETDDGLTRATVPVENTADVAREATLSVTIAGGNNRYTASTSISVPADTEREYSVVFDIEWTTVSADSQPSVREVFLYNPAYRS